MFDRRFVAWDGEGFDGKLVLLASSDGATLHRLGGLGTSECLDLLLDGDRSAAHVWYGFGWDVNMILGDVPLMGRRHSLRDLYENGETTWNGYHLKYIPRKMFNVWTRVDGEVRSFTSYDAIGFFQSSFVRALEGWGFKVPKKIRVGKAGRGDFSTWKMRDLIEYNAEECRLLVALMDKFRAAIGEAGWRVNGWHGAGALASWWLKEHRVKTHLRHPTKKLNALASVAYFGGRIDAAAWGSFEGVHHYDINSAYPTAFAECLDLSTASYRVRSDGDVSKAHPASLVSLTWSAPLPSRPSPWWGPFPYRTRAGSIMYPPEGSGVYFAVEVQAAIRRVKGLRVKILEIVEPVGDLSTPFADAITTAYTERARLKDAGSPANVPIKLGLNSLYGKLAQRKTFGGQVPTYYSLLWAGYITARTRSLISDAIAAANGDVVAVMTDGVFSRRKLDLPISRKLGEWEEEEPCRLDIAEPGVYRLTYDDGRTEEYTRGYEPETGLTAPDLVEAWERGDSTCVRYEVDRFVGMALAVNFRYRFRPLFRTFTTIAREFEPVWIVGTTKRVPWNPGGARPRPGVPHWLAPREAIDPGVCSASYSGVPSLSDREEAVLIELLATETSEDAT